jgi:hypothetical protein
MKNSVTLNKDGIIEIFVIGDQTVETVTKMGAETKRLLEDLGKQGRPQLILDDITKLGLTNIAARKAVSELAHSLPYKKVAMLGDGSVLMRIGTTLLLHGVGMGGKVHYFEDRDKAVKWLLST